MLAGGSGRCWVERGEEEASSPSTAALWAPSPPSPSTWKGSVEPPCPLSTGGRFVFITGSARIAITFNVIASPVLPMEKNMGLEWLPGDHGQGVIHL